MINRSLLVVLTLVTGAATLAARPPAARRIDPRVAALVNGVSADRIRRDVEQLAAFGTRHTLSDLEHPTRGIGAAQRWVRREMEQIATASGGRLQVETDTFTRPAGGRLTRPTGIRNTVATLPGTDASRVLVVSGHLDCRATNVLDGTSDAPGADDDASGVAAVLELAWQMAPRQFRATVVFLVVGAEEQGLLGSRHWAQAARQTDRSIEAMLNNDIIGSSRGADGTQDRRHVRLFSEGVPAVETPAAARRRAAVGENDSPSRELARAVADAQRRYLPRFGATLVFRRDRYLRGGDQTSFTEQGYAAVRFTEMNEDWRHQHQDVRVRDSVQFGDLPQFVDFAYVADVARVNLAALADLAWAPPPPLQVRLVTRLEASTTLRWDTPADADRLGYEILWRHTTAPDWEGARLAGSVGEVTLPQSKDDFIFAVRAVSRAGNRGLPVVAAPGAPARGGSGGRQPGETAPPAEVP
jgi:hypothetical protein